MNHTELQDWVRTEMRSNQDFSSNFNASDLTKVLTCIDLTTLHANDSPASVNAFVVNGLKLLKKNNRDKVAAICVYSNFTAEVSKLLKGSEISTACVAASFPHGQANLESKVLEVANAAKAGADDIDVVINRGMVLDNDYESLGKEIKAFANAAGKAHLKVILEVCELNLEQVYLAAMVVMENGADFIKTSTGKGVSGASIEASLVMCLAIKDHFFNSQKMVGFKAAGGISSSSDAMQYWNLVQHVLGNNWMNKRYFRIGASSLLKNIIADLT